VQRLAAVSLVVAVTACTGSIDGSDEDIGPDAGTATPVIGDPEAVARAMQWVDAKLPYCQAPNHAHDNDADCSSTCTRPDNPQWDPYRSDCSGLVSWAWGLPAPGRTTGTLAPYDMTVSHPIAAMDLLPGDAINNDHHTMLFAEWITQGTVARFIEEPGCSSTEPYAREVMATVTLMGQQVMVKNRGAYTAIRVDR